MALTSHAGLHSAIDVFLADFDLNELVDTCKHLVQQGLPKNYAFVNGNPKPSIAALTQPLFAPTVSSIAPAPSLSPKPNNPGMVQTTLGSSNPHPISPALGQPSLSNFSSTPAFSPTPTPTVASTATNSSVPATLTDPEWRAKLEAECSQKYFQDIIKFVADARKRTTVFPPEEEVYSALNLTPLSQVKAVIIGQDPYFNDGQVRYSPISFGSVELGIITSYLQVNNGLIDLGSWIVLFRQEGCETTALPRANLQGH